MLETDAPQMRYDPTFAAAPHVCGEPWRGTLEERGPTGSPAEAWVTRPRVCGEAT